MNSLKQRQHSTMKTMPMKRKLNKNILYASCLFVYLNLSVALSDTDPIPGEIVATFTIPPEFEAMNGIAWDGSKLWGVDYRKSTSSRYIKYIPSFLKNIFASGEINLVGANAYRLDLSGVSDGGLPAIDRTLNLGYPEMEGLGHDMNSTLFIGARTDGSRESAKIIAASTYSGEIIYELSDYTWPDGEKHGTYSDPDGIAFGDDLLFWLVNAGHSDVPRAAVQVMTTSGKVVKRFWLSDEVVNDIAYGFGYIIYKPADENVIKLVKVDEINDSQVAEVRRSFPIYDAEVVGHWGLAYDNEQQHLYLSQDAPNGFIWRIYLPKSVFQ